MRPVSQDRRVVDKERFRLVSFRKVNHEIVEHVRAIVLWRCRKVLAVSNQAGMPEATGLSAFFLSRMLNTFGQIMIVSPHQVFIEPRVSHERRKLSAELPLARLRRYVASCFHQIGMSEMMADVSLWRISGRLKGRVLHSQKSVVKAILASHQADSSWSTQWHGVKRFETCSLCCHAIQIGSLMPLAAVARQFLRTQIIGEDQNHIRSSLCSCKHYALHRYDDYQNDVFHNEPFRVT